MMFNKSFLQSLCAFTTVVSPITYAARVSIPFVPAYDARHVSGSFISFSIEPDRWTDWVGTTKRNDFFFNALENLKKITGESPHVRVGGNTEDRTDFSDEANFSDLTFPAVDSIKAYPEATQVTVGDGYYRATRFLPTGTRVTWGVNLGDHNITATYLQTRAIIKAFSSPEIRDKGIVLDYIEIGNEPDLYNSHGDRAKNYDVKRWVNEWLNFATNVSSTASISSSSATKFLGASLAFSTHAEDGFSPQNAVESGLLTGPGTLISTISQHHYSASFCTGRSGTLQDLLTKSNIRGNLTQFQPDIKAMNALGLNYILGETNSYSCHGAPGISDTAGAALWALDYALYATQLNITRVFFHNGIGFKYNLLQPAALTRSIRDGSELPAPMAPHVQPLYYAAIIAAEAVGDSGNVRIDELDIDDEQISAYAIYEGGQAVRVVFINMNVYDPHDNDERSSVHIDLKFFNESKRKPLLMMVKRLIIDDATDTSGVTWGGQTYETKDGRPEGTLTIEIRLVDDGVDIRDTEVVLVEFLPIYLTNSGSS